MEPGDDSKDMRWAGELFSHLRLVKFTSSKMTILRGKISMNHGGYGEPASGRKP